MQAINWSWCLWVARPSPLRSFVVQLPHERKPPLQRGRQPCPERLRGGVLWPPLWAVFDADRSHATARARWPGHTNTRSVPWYRCVDKHGLYARGQAGCTCDTIDIMRRR